MTLHRQFALLILPTLIACSGGGENETLRHEVDAWHAERLARLQDEDGWLTLVGLHELVPGANTIGAEAGLQVQLQAMAPARVGTLRLADGTIRFTPEAGVEIIANGEPVTAAMDVASDAAGAATVFAVGTVRFHVIARGDRRFLRVKDHASEVLREFQGVDRFPVDARWRVTARLETEGQPTTVPSTNVLGQVAQEPSPGVLVFELGGQEHRLTPVGAPGRPLFIVFADLTNGQSTYGGGRFLSAEAPDSEGRVVLDFNRATNPPCAFTPYATCPMPPFSNRLPVAVEAGEKRWGEHH